ncbi:hypothetical protein AYO49_05450 [Verrucomicrobiaceae bacterium SCGC AG-212-N21]|nr:hypothetical protein AYO49_05450 [Verrucomicrobiaceae bacterium SCGC AG-212-N21]
MSLINIAKKAIFGLLKTEPIKDTAELLAACQEYAKDQIARDAKKVQLDAELQLVKDKHEGEIESLNSKLEHHFKRIHNFAITKRVELFGDRQSYIIAGHELAFRESPGAIGFAEGHNADSVVEAILNMEGEEGDKLRETLLRVKAELDKKAAMRVMRQKDNGPAAKLTALGVVIEAPESFAFMPARDALANMPDTTDATLKAAA